MTAFNNSKPPLGSSTQGTSRSAGPVLANCIAEVTKINCNTFFVAMQGQANTCFGSPTSLVPFRTHSLSCSSCMHPTMLPCSLRSRSALVNLAKCHSRRCALTIFVKMSAVFSVVSTRPKGTPHSRRNSCGQVLPTRLVQLRVALRRCRPCPRRSWP